jgi:predicted nuclease with TOPRIM domain
VEDAAHNAATLEKHNAKLKGRLEKLQSEYEELASANAEREDELTAAQARMETVAADLDRMRDTVEQLTC